MSSFKEFHDLDIKLGKVLECHEISDSESLLELKVDVGEEKPRKIISAIKEWYKPEDLIGEFVLIATNLKLDSLNSEGFLLAVDADNSAVLLKPDPIYKAKIKPGMKLA
ncbi:MAG: methionine--tRNA ligase [Promethearchaeia archaeon]|nr:MAG: methionine--tRNA ligase [Candidatus Lokiarchaeia archaeon]